MSDLYAAKELTTFAEIAAQYPLIRQLNADLTIEAYESMLREMLPRGYRQVGIFRDDHCVGLSGFWVGTKFYCGRYIEMDNVIVDAEHRSAGIGKMLADWIVQKGESEGCRVAMLDAYVHNGGAHRFYFREGYTIVGFHLQRNLESN